MLHMVVSLVQGRGGGSLVQEVGVMGGRIWTTPKKYDCVVHVLAAKLIFSNNDK